MPNLFILKFKHFFVFTLISLNLNHVLSEILVYKNTSTEKVVRVISDYEFNVGFDFSDDGIMAYIVAAEPEDACSQIKPPPESPFNSFDSNSKFNWFVLVDQDSCLMDKKLENVKNAGYNGVIIYAKLPAVNLPEINYQSIVDLPVLFVTHVDGRQIKNFYTYEKGYFALFLKNSPFKLYLFLIPFLVVIGGCIITIISFVISQLIRCYNERNKRKKNRLAKRHLKKIPTINFKKGDHYEICAICLDEFQEGVKLRLLTCGHAYHLKCIDPWLTENRRNCPICKGKVVVPDMTESESENDTENENRNNATERTPLLSNTNNSQNAISALSNNLIFPIGQRVRRSGRHTLLTTNQNNIPSTSNIINNDLVINVQAPNNQSQQNLVRSSSVPRFSSINRKSNRRRPKMMINAEINSPQSTTENNLNANQPTTSNIINIDDEQESNSSNSTGQINLNRTLRSNNLSTNSNLTSTNGQNQLSNSNYGSRSNISPSRRQDNIV